MDIAWVVGAEVRRQCRNRVDVCVAVNRRRELVPSAVLLPRKLARSGLPLVVTTGLAVAAPSEDERPEPPTTNDPTTPTAATNPPAPQPDDPDAQPPAYSETVVVTASRAEESIVDSVALVTSLDADALAQSPGALVDEALSRVPGFGLFRRNTSLISHPPHHRRLPPRARPQRGQARSTAVPALGGTIQLFSRDPAPALMPTTFD